MRIRSFAAGVLASLLMVALPMTSAWAAHRSDAEAAIHAAKEVNEKAAAAGLETAGTAALIEQAEGLLTTRQYTKAIDLADLAKKQDGFGLRLMTSETVREQASSGMDDAEKAIAAAEAARKKAASVGGEWRDTGKMIKKAQAAMKAGELDKAVEIANKAARQGELGYTQAMAEVNAGFPSYMHPKQ